jgi:threonine synthase
MREHFAGDWVTNDESLAVIRRVWEDHGYLLDPHTAVAWEVAERLATDDPMLVVSTAHWAKFGEDVYKALSNLGYADPLPAEARSMSGVDLVECVARLAPGAAPIPRNLATLGAQPVRFEDVVDPGREGVETAVTAWLETA